MVTYRSRFRFAHLACGWLLTLPGLTLAHDAAPAKAKELAVSPAPPPTPALRYRLLPISSELNPGDAAPIYLRIRHELKDDSWDQLDRKVPALLDASRDQFPVQEGRQIVNQWATQLRLLELGTRREYCDWSFTLPEQRLDAIEILLPDTQSMRAWARLLALKARVEAAEGKLDQALGTIETGLAFGRHVSEGPFLINSLVGIAICNSMLDRLEELIEQPGAPNLYWALTALPRPLVSLRKAMEQEQRLAENMIPELTQIDQPHSRAEWAVLLEQLYARMHGLTRKVVADDSAAVDLRKRLDLDFEAFKKEGIPWAREYLAGTGQVPDSRLKLMSDDEAVARAIVTQQRDLRDEVFKATYLPWREGQAQLEAAEQRQKSIKSGPMVLFAALHPSLKNTMAAEMRLERRVGLLRLAEALRIHAAAHAGKLPEALSQVADVPIPDDPATGRPFEYRRDGASAVIPTPPDDLKAPIASYRITVRDRKEAPGP